MTEITTSPETLRSELRGAIVLPGESRWDAARAAWNLAVDQRPAAVVEAADVGDVQAAIRFAAANGLRVAPQSTGHGSEGLPPLDDAILLKTSALRELSVDPVAQTARIGAGVQAHEVAAATGAHGLSAVLGLAPTVGAIGLTLGGGMGWLSRAHGLAAHSAIAFDLVTPRGDLLRVDADREPDLFWALRGGGTAGGVVTAMEVRLHPLPEAFGGLRMWPAEHAADVLEQFRRVVDGAPESLSAVFRYLAIPDIEGPPPFLRGQRVVAIAAVHLGSAADGERAIAPLRAGNDVLVDTFAPIGAADLTKVAMDPEGPGAGLGGGLLLHRLEPATLHAVRDLIAGDAMEGMTILELRQLGGAIARGGDSATGAITEPISVFAGGPAFDPGAPARIAAKLDTVRAALAPWASSRMLLSMSADAGPEQAFGAEARTRLERIRDTTDPDGLLIG